jgi:3-isopropylmalate/(R)-2-methylmalate dehydratase small subunit
MTSLGVVLRGTVWRFGDSVDTNQLAGSGSVHTVTDDELRRNCLRGIRPDFTARVRPGDILVAGANFGCGSSRQTAVRALQLCGVAAVLAESVARIHQRNSVALGLPTFALPGITDLLAEEDVAEVDYAGRVVRNLTRGTAMAVPPLPPSVEQIYDAGGIRSVIVARLRAAGVAPSASG